MRALMSRRTESPRTILGFHATVIGIVLTFGLGVTVSLAATEVMTWLIPVVLALAFGGACIDVAAVFLLSRNDPSKLMLGQVTGHEYAEIQRVVLGDSSSGERTADPLVARETPSDEPVAIAMERPRLRVREVAAFDEPQPRRTARDEGET